jgi:AcrR family transcriptional regulator
LGRCTCGAGEQARPDREQHCCQTQQRHQSIGHLHLHATEMTLTAEIIQIKIYVIFSDDEAFPVPSAYHHPARTRQVPALPEGRRRGRPVGGGITAEQSKDAFLDAAESLFATRGYRESTMEMIAREAGFSRGSIYRQFPTRESLVEALVQRTTQRHMARIRERLPEGADAITILIEAMVIVATELIHDPLLKTISDQTDDRTVAYMLAGNPALLQMVEASIAAMMTGTNRFRPGISPKDLAQFIIGTNLSMLLGAIPGIEDPKTARSYIDVFVLPALIADPPDPRRVFPG